MLAQCYQQYRCKICSKVILEVGIPQKKLFAGHSFRNMLLGLDVVSAAASNEGKFFFTSLTEKLSIKYGPSFAGKFTYPLLWSYFWLFG
jgi:hypothetical protein